MIFTGFKRKSNQNFFKKHLRDFTDNLLGKPFDKVQRVLIISDSINNIESTALTISEKIGVKKDQISILVFQKKMNKKNESFSEIIFTPKDFGWYGKISEEKLNSILTNNHDLLINCSKVENIYSNLLILHANVNFRVGFSTFNKSLYNLLIKSDSDAIDVFSDEMRKYLKIIGKI